MESWNRGRGKLLEQLENVCNQIGVNIASELKNDNFAQISHEELRILRETSASIQKLAESHGRLTDELEICRGAAAKVEELEKENKRLAQELQTKLNQDAASLEKPAARVQIGSRHNLTPGSSEPPSFVARIEPGESTVDIQKKYDNLVKKYNKTCQKYEAMKGAKEFTEKVAKEERTKCQDWKDWGKNMDEKVEKKDEKIRKLKEEISELKSKLDGQENEAGVELTSDQQPEAIQTAQKVPPLIVDVTDAHVQVPASSPPETHRHENGNLVPGPKPLEPLKTSDGHGYPNETEMELPPMRDGERYIGDTGSEPLEAHHTSSTEGDPDPVLPEIAASKGFVANPETETEKPSSPAVYMYSRSVKKRKVRDQDGDETPGPKIKTEVIELSSPHTPIPAYINTNESMDLDDIGEKVSTPRKSHKVAVLSQHVSRLIATSQMSGQSGSQSQGQKKRPKISVPTPARQEKAVLQPRSVNTNILPRTSDYTRVPKKRRIASDRDVAEITEDGEIITIKKGLRKQLSDSDELLVGLLSKPSPGRPVLSPQQLLSTVHTPVISTNRTERPTPRAQSATTSVPARDLLGGTPHAGSDAMKLNKTKSKTSREPTPNSRPSSTRGSREPIDLTVPSSKRVNQGPESSRPSSDQVPRSSAESFRPSSKTSARSSKEPSLPDDRPQGRSSSPFVGTQLPARRDLASAFKSRTVDELIKASSRTPTVARPGRPSRHGTGTGKKKQIRTEVDYEMDPSQEPLRSRPMSKLGLSDFKINPAYNEGYDYAFGAVVRGKEARAHLEGCIKPHCCGDKFRGVAKAELDNRPSTLSQKARDETLLEDYLGDGADRLMSMSEDEKEETLIKAKIREIANKSGRHRQAYHKAKDPAGFWRADFPTTQEEIEERKIDLERERETVEERYNHAMRHGGAWLFRDE